MTAIRWAHVSHDFGQGEVLLDVSLDIAAGESVALLGHNGAGKTTLTRMLMGLVRPRSGEVFVGDWSVRGRRPDQMAARVGYAFQHADQQLFARSVAEDVAFGPRRLGRNEGEPADVLREMALTDVAGRHPYDLPAPVRKLVALAGVLAMRPEVLVLDEPTAGMDGGLRERVVQAVRARLAQGVTVLAISHDLDFVAGIARREVTLEQGRVIRDERRLA